MDANLKFISQCALAAAPVLAAHALVQPGAAEVAEFLFVGPERSVEPLEAISKYALLAYGGVAGYCNIVGWNRLGERIQSALPRVNVKKLWDLSANLSIIALGGTFLGGVASYIHGPQEYPFFGAEVTTGLGVLGLGLRYLAEKRLNAATPAHP